MKKSTFCSFRTLSVVSLVSAFVGVLLMIVRIWHPFSFSEPLQLIKVFDYPWLKRLISRFANYFIAILFQIKYGG